MYAFKFHIQPNADLPIEVISKIRKTVIEKMIAPLNEDLEARLKPTTCCTQDTVLDSAGRSLCDAAILGSIYRGMIMRQGRILPKDSFCITQSVMELGSWLFPLMAEVHTYSYHGHQMCSLQEKYKKHNLTLQASIPNIVRECLKPSHKEYMASQRLKIGVASHPEPKVNLRLWKLT